MRYQWPGDPGNDEFDHELLDWLRGLDEQHLTRVLSNRPEALDLPWPRRLDDLALRLAEPGSVMLALRGLCMPELQLLRALQLCYALSAGDVVLAGAVTCRLDAAKSDVTRTVDGLAARALAWICGDGSIRLVEPLRGMSLEQYGLGVSVAEVLPRCTVDQLKGMASMLGVPVGGRKQQIVDALLGFFRDPDNIAGLAATAPADAAALLTECAWHGPTIECYLGSFGIAARHDQPERPWRWAAKRGLLWDTYEGTAHMPLEVALALRGPEYRLPFAPQAPRPELVTATEEQVATECSSAALRMVDSVVTVVASTRSEPLPLLKSGRVGVQAINKLSKRTGVSARQARLAVELAINTGMLFPHEPAVTREPPRRRASRSRRRREPAGPPPGLVATEEFARWSERGSAQRLRVLLSSWWELADAPLEDQKRIRVVLGGDASGAFVHVRQLTVRLFTELGDSSGIASAAAAGTGAGSSGDSAGDLVALVAWHAPMLHRDVVHTLVQACLAEAAALGVIASGAPGDLAHALVACGSAIDGDAPGLLKAAGTVVAAARTTARFGTDLTAIVTGPPDVELAAMLDRAADREMQSSATSWRFSPASVRRAFDHGASAAALFDELGAAAGGELPQPLTYLINDVARRHGQVGVIDVGCVLLGEDPALLAEIAAQRPLATLGLHNLAPTVLAATADATATLAALRKAGYAPQQRESDGSIVLPATTAAAPAAAVTFGCTAARASQPDQDAWAWDGYESAEPLPAPDPADHAARLLAVPAPSGRRLRRGDLSNALYREQGERFTPDWMALAWKLEAGLPASIEYLDGDGQRYPMLISEPELDGEVLDVWCSSAGGYQRLELGRISPRPD